MTEKQKRFCDEYLIDLNATQAAIRAGYNEKTAYSMGQRLLKKVEIQNEIQHLKDERSERTEITQDMVVNELAAIAFADATDFVQVVKKPFTNDAGEEVMLPDVEITETNRLTPLQKNAIAGIKQGRNGIELKQNDKTRALELLGKHLGMFTDNVQVNGNLNNPFEGMTTEELKKLVDDD